MKLIMIVCISFVMTTGSNAQQHASLPDMMTTDITTLSSFDGSNVSFRGFHLGMSRQDAIQKLKTINDWVWEFDSFNTKSQSPASTKEMRIYVNLKNADGSEDPAVLYLLWDSGMKGITSIVFFKAAAPMLAGHTSQLFTAGALDKSCTCRQFLKGEPEEETDNIGITLTRFKAQHFQLISMPENSSRKVWFKLIR